MAVPSEVVETFQREGVVVLRGVFGGWTERLAAGVARLRAAPSALERSYRPADGSAPFFQDFCNWQRIAEFRAFVLESPAAALAAALMGSSTARFFHDHVLIKEPGSSVVTPWHQDAPYYCVAGSQSVSFWTPLDPVGREVALECIAGSHRWSESGFRPVRFDGSPLFPGADFADLPDLEARRADLPVRSWALEPGDAVAFDFRTVHGAPANASLRPRRVFSHRWVGDDARFVAQRAHGSPPFPHLELADGAPFEAPECPVVWRG
ncbi:MAG: phytanoyl-CoA dioxygenase family protein [Proteobacteria bacterium]|nr:phytanoyl-CoA dioxygenase family protein [Pseudomonadota bacterium]